MGILSIKKKRKKEKPIEEVEEPEDGEELEEKPEEEPPKKEISAEDKQMVEEIKGEIGGFVKRYGGLYEPGDFSDFFKPEVCKLLFAILQEMKKINQKLEES